MRVQRCISLILLVFVCCLNVTTIFANESAGGKKVFFEQYFDDSLAFGSGANDELLFNQDEEYQDGRSNRFIIKYCEEENDDTALGEIAQSIADFRAVTHKDSMFEEGHIPRDNKNYAVKNTTVSEAGTPKVMSLKSEYRILEFDDKIDVETVEDIILSELSDKIEYIQPDYEIKLASVDDESIEEITLDIAIYPIGNIEDAEDYSDETEPDVSSEEEESFDFELNDDIEIDEIDIAEESEEQPDFQALESVTVAIIDGGVDVTHEALLDKIRLPWDFVNNCELTYDNTLNTDYYHGTHIAGIIADGDDGIQIMPLKVFENGTAYTSDIISAIEYAQENGAKVVNCSWGSTDYNRALFEAIEQSDMLFVCAAGNNRMNIDETPIYPACFDLPNIISVASLNNDLGFSYYSNYGVENVDISAVGRNVYSTLPNDEYGEMSGTSMSAALVSNAAAISCLLGNNDLPDSLFMTADKLVHLTDKVDCGRSLNIANLREGIFIDEYSSVAYDEDFDVTGYQMTPSESWDLFCGLDTVQIEAGSNFCVVLKANGTIWTWGNNNSGQLGNGTNTSSRTPVQVIGLSNAVYISAFGTHAFAVTDTGNVFGWGYNSSGLLGDGTSTNRNTPTQVTGLSSIFEITTGATHAVALKNDGTVWGWGNNERGQLDKVAHPNAAYYSPIQMNGLSSIEKVDAGGWHTLALKSDGTVWAWGKNYYGSVGNGTTAMCGVTQLSAVQNVVEISAGYYHSAAVKSDGTVLMWGHNGYGQLGDGTTTNRSVPVETSNLSDVTDVKTGQFYSLALCGNGTVKAWGRNNYGQLGLGSTTSCTSPTMIQYLNNITLLATGSAHTLAMRTDGVLYSWGDNTNDQLGYDITEETSTPQMVSALLDVDEIYAGNNQSFAVKYDGSVWAWGENTYGQLGDGTTVDRTIPTEITSLSDVEQIAVGYNHTLALKSDGTVWAWGRNNYGQLGIGNAEDKHVPTQVASLSNITSIAVGYNHSFAIKSDGTVWAWGYNTYGQLGDGTNTLRRSPVQISSLTNIIAIDGGYCHSICVKSDGSVWTWGRNNNYQLGDGTNSNKNIPTQWTGSSGFVSVKAGYAHCVALKSNGTVWVCGDNSKGQYGDGTTTAYSYPAQVPNLSSIAVIDSDGNFVAVISSSNTIQAWGQNTNGQLGTGDYITKKSPTMITSVVGVYEIKTGGFHAMYLTNDSTVYATGGNNHGQLGMTGIRISTSPYAIQAGLSDIHADTWDDAHQIELGDSIDGAVNYLGDEDWFMFDPTFRDEYEITVSSNCSRLVYKRENNTLTEVVADASTGNFLLPYGSEYYIKVFIDENMSVETGLYTLSVSRAAIEISAEYQTSAVSGEYYDLTISSQNVADFFGLVYEIEYDRSVFEIYDLCALTPMVETGTGNVSELGVQIDAQQPGIVRISVYKDIEAEKHWSGTINVIRFRGRTTAVGDFTVTLTNN